MDFESWAATELFEYLVDNYVISDDESFEDWKHDRTDMLKLCKEYCDEFNQ